MNIFPEKKGYPPNQGFNIVDKNTHNNTIIHQAFYLVGKMLTTIQ
jgi:hypothetical protein